MIFNILITKKDRNKQLELCLKSLEVASKKVENLKYYAYIGEVDSIENYNLDLLRDNEVVAHLESSNTFCRGTISNRLLNLMEDDIFDTNEDYKGIIFLDVDMIVSEDFFIRIIDSINKGFNYITFQGIKLSKEHSEYRMNNDNKEEFYNKSLDEEFKVCASQMYISKDVYELYLDIFKPPFFDEFYEGWGCEDSDISFKSRHLVDKNLIKKTNLYKMWLHLWHESTNTDAEAYNRNYKYFQEKVARFGKIVDDYCNRKKK